MLSCLDSGIYSFVIFTALFYFPNGKQHTSVHVGKLGVPLVLETSPAAHPDGLLGRKNCSTILGQNSEFSDGNNSAFM